MDDAHFVRLMQSFDVPAKTTVAVAVSGGADSMALVLLVSEWAKKSGRKLIALTVDHGLRKEAALEALQVSKWLKKRGIPHHILSYKGPKPATNIQAFARELRYRLMRDYCEKNRIHTLLVAHTLEDQVETFLMRLERGSGIDGLSAMPAVQSLGAISLLRPLLSVQKSSLIQYLKKHKQRFIEDPSNQNADFARVRVRSLLKEHAEPLLNKRIFDASIAAGRARHALEVATNEAFANAATLSEMGFLSIDAKKFSLLSEEIALRMLSSALATISGSDEEPRFEKLMRLYQSLSAPNFKTTTLHGVVIEKKSAAILLYREPSKAASTKEFLEFGVPVLWDGRFEITLTKKRQGLVVQALKPSDVKKLRSQPKAKNLSAQMISTLPGIYHLENLVACPHIEFYAPGIKALILYRFLPRTSLRPKPFIYCREAADIVGLTK